LQAGLTLEQAVEHSLPQLKLLASAANRLQARSKLLDLETVFAAMAACHGSKGNQIKQQMRKALEKQAW
jgi:hypothetical protein